MTTYSDTTSVAVTSTTLETIDGKIPTKGQKTKAGSVPVTLASDEDDVTITLDGEAVVLGAGSEVIGLVGIDQTTANANEIEIKNIQVALSADIDSIDVAKKSKGAITTVHDTIADTATSAEVDCRGFNCLLVYVGPFSAAEDWTFKLQGCMTSGGTFVDWYELANTGAMVAMSYQCNAARGFTFRGIPDYLKIVATRDGGASTVSVSIQPFNG